MKRDWELMGRIFTAIENEQLGDFLEQVIHDNPPPDDSSWKQSEQVKTVFKHLEMLIDAGYVKGVVLRTSDDVYLYGLQNPRITLQGYDYADIVEDHALLKQTINAIGKAGLMVSWETLKQFAPVLIKKAAMKYANKIMKED